MISGSNKYARAIRELQTSQRRLRGRQAPGTLIDITTGGTFVRSKGRTGAAASAGQRELPRWL